METTEVQKLEQELYTIYEKLVKLRRDTPLVEVKNYSFQTLTGEVSLLELFAGKENLFVIHNMGQTCPHCTLWADGLNPFLPHLEEKFSVVLVSRDTPEVQRRIANDRGWRYRMASHGGKGYIIEQSTARSDNPEANNYPGLVYYEKKDNKVFRKNYASFGPGDEFCSIWNMLSLAGQDEGNWEPQFKYMNYPGRS